MFSLFCCMCGWRLLESLFASRSVGHIPRNIKHESCRLAGYDKTNTSDSYFAVSHEENLFCELFIASMYSKSSWYALHFEHKMTKPSIIDDSLFTRCSWMLSTSNESHFQFNQHQMYLRVLSFYRHKHKRQRPHVGNSVSRKQRRKNLRAVFCAVYPTA